MAGYVRDPNYRDPMNDFGLAVTMFCATHAMTKKQLAEEAGIPYDTLLQVGKGRRAGHTARAAVQAVFDRYAAEDKKRRRKGRGA